MPPTQVGTQPINGPIISIPVTAGALDISWQAADPVNGNYFVWDSPRGDILLVWNTGTESTGSASSYAILGGSGVTNSDGASTVITNGNIGSYPTNSIVVGTPAWTLVNSAVVAAVAQNQTDLANAIAIYQAQGPGTVIATALDGQTLTPGVYSTGSGTMTLSGGTLTLNGAGTYVLLMATTLSLTGASQVALTGGATADNVFFVCGSSMTAAANAGTLFNGNILASVSITVNGGTYHSRLLAHTGAVVISTPTAITAPTGAGSAGWTLTSTPDACNLRLGDITNYSMSSNDIMAFNFATVPGWATQFGPSIFHVVFSANSSSVLFAVLER